MLRGVRNFFMDSKNVYPHGEKKVRTSVRIKFCDYNPIGSNVKTCVLSVSDYSHDRTKFEQKLENILWNARA